MNKKQLYESIMKVVSREVKKALNENQLNEKLSDFREKYKNTASVAEVFDKIMSIVKPFQKEKTFDVCNLYEIRNNSPYQIDQFYAEDKITGDEIVNDYVKDGIQLRLDIYVEEKAYIDYMDATTTKANGREFKVLSEIDDVNFNVDTWIMNTRPTSKLIIINLSHLAEHADKLEIFCKWLSGNMD
ncbi:MAG: hypothetical protein [Wendovervirus sonii]|uniref:Uncharacterized protein n=1 Tax=phage Lak_Megaphage_Sonny TaxID=3109229 RepID=A0ABZ0Z731_9CAUD|nr:MAG: hypothetical protein [phage Lak_Megaphage_Sonny]